MKPDFVVYSAFTVPSGYSWDIGTPVDGSIKTTIPAYTTQTYASGYAPGVKVFLLNTSIVEPNFSLTNYNWNFGDYYNDEGNVVTLSCLSITERTYVMPGKYTVTLNITQTQTQEDEQPDIINPNDYICRGKDGIRWFWDNLTGTTLSSVCITWDESVCNPFEDPTSSEDYSKWWDDELKCFQKHCKLWSWEAMKGGYEFYSSVIRPGEPIKDNPVRWSDTKDRRLFTKKWMYEANNKPCNLNIIEIVDDLEDTISRFTVEVVEIPPVAGITCLTRPITGYSPFTVQLSPSACKCGSFPIDRIDWDFGDGSPIKTVTRYFSLTTDPNLIYTDTYFSDSLDVRNFDVQHTYYVNKNTYPVFYPSLTCYSANTNTSDSCSTTVGPILYPQTPENVLPIKVKNTLKGTVYGFNVNKNLVFTTTTQLENVAPIVNIPQNKLIDSIKDNILVQRTERGNPNLSGYPQFVTPSCNLSGIIFYNQLITEDNNQPPPAENLPNTPITTENSFDIIP